MGVKKLVIDTITKTYSGRLESDLGWLRGGLGCFGGGLGLTWRVNVIKMLLNFFFNY